jgi:NADPH:quinone reductase-like Zn-dependent oxidoreductase
MWGTIGRNRIKHAACAAYTIFQLFVGGFMPVVITGALGSVGRTAVWVAKKLGAHVIAGVRGSQKKAAEELGADALLALDSREEVDALGLVDVVADTIGGAVNDALLGKVKPGGVYALSGRCSYCGIAGAILTAKIGTNGRRRCGVSGESSRRSRVSGPR